MTTTLTQTYNRDDIRRVYASFAADYRIVAEWTKLHTPAYVTTTIEQIKILAEEQYLKEVHLQLRSSNGAVREASVYRVSANASGWSSDRPGDLYWQTYEGDHLRLIVTFTPKWSALSQAERDAFMAAHLPTWGASNLSLNYSTMSNSTDRRFASRAYGMERTRYSGY